MNNPADQEPGGNRYDTTAQPISPEWPVEVDLHFHTTASDGTLTPTKLIEQIATTSLKTIAITDHDSTDGVDEAISASKLHSHLSIIPGLELGTATDDSKLHLLGYFIDTGNSDLQSILERFRSERIDSARAMVDRLRELKRPIEWKRVMEIANGAIGRPHIARAMIEAGHVGSVAEAFERYIGDKGPAMVERPKLHPADALAIIHSAGGIGVLAHPRTVNRLDSVIRELVEAGLAGIEVYAEKYVGKRRDDYLSIATKYDLVSSGGSDYHASGAQNEVIPGMNGPPPDTGLQLLSRAVEKHGSNVGFVPTGLS